MTVYIKLSAPVDFKAKLLTSFDKILNSLFLDNVFIFTYTENGKKGRNTRHRLVQYVRPI